MLVHTLSSSNLTFVQSKNTKPQSSLLHIFYYGMPCPFTGPKMFFAGPNFFVPDQKFIYILWQSQIFCARQIAFSKIGLLEKKVLKRH